MSKQPQVIKATGETENFSQYKLIRNLNQAGVNKPDKKKLQKLIEQNLFNNAISSNQIHQITLQYLQQTDPASAARYNLRKAVMDLGPTGFPFEQYVARVLKAQKYQTRTNQIIHGSCATHEVDIVASKENVRYMVECKYHNRRGTKSDLKTALYVWARFEDIDEAWHQSQNIDEKFHQAWLVTNTKVTTDAEEYAKCRGLTVISWYRPYHHSLKDQIISTGLWPITCITSLNEEDKKMLIENNIVICKDILKNPKSLLKKLKIKNLENILNEAETICKTSQ